MSPGEEREDNLLGKAWYKVDMNTASEHAGYRVGSHDTNDTKLFHASAGALLLGAPLWGCTGPCSSSSQVLFWVLCLLPLSAVPGSYPLIPSSLDPESPGTDTTGPIFLSSCLLESFPLSALQLAQQCPVSSSELAHKPTQNLIHSFS